MNKPLTKQEAIELVAQGVVRDGKLTEAGQTLMLGHLWLVRKLATKAKKKWRWPKLDDLEGEATEALIDAIMLLKADSTNPTSYIWTSIDGRLKDWRTLEADKRLEFRHKQMPDETMSFKDQLFVATVEDTVKKRPQPFVGLIGKADHRAWTRGITDTSDAMRAFPNQTPSKALSDIIETEEWKLWDELEAMNNSPKDLQIIKLLRADHTLTIEELAGTIGCAKSTVSYGLAAIRERAVALGIIVELTAWNAEQNLAEAGD